MLHKHVTYLVGILVVGRGREEGVPAHAGSGHRALRVLRSRGGIGVAAVYVDHVAVLDGHGVHALLVSLPAQDLGREGKWGMNALKRKCSHLN